MKKKGLFIVVSILMFTLLPKIVMAGSLTSLKVRGIEEELSTKNAWNLTYVSPRDSMVVEATPADSSYTIEGIGRIPLQEGTNKAIVVVKDASGAEVERYELNVNFSHSQGTLSTSSSTSSKETFDGKVPNPNTGLFINIVPLIIGFTFLIIIITFGKKKKIYKI